MRLFTRESRLFTLANERPLTEEWIISRLEAFGVDRGIIACVRDAINNLEDDERQWLYSYWDWVAGRQKGLRTIKVQSDSRLFHALSLMVDDLRGNVSIQAKDDGGSKFLDLFQKKSSQSVRVAGFAVGSPSVFPLIPGVRDHLLADVTQGRDIFSFLANMWPMNPDGVRKPVVGRGGKSCVELFSVNTTDPKLRDIGLVPIPFNGDHVLIEFMNVRFQDGVAIPYVQIKTNNGKPLCNVFFQSSADGSDKIVRRVVYKTGRMLEILERDRKGPPDKRGVFRKIFDFLFDERSGQEESPHTLAWFWGVFSKDPTHNLLSKAPWESSGLALGAGAVVMGGLLFGWSPWTILVVPVAAGLLGFSHVFGTYTVENGRLAGAPMKFSSALREGAVWFAWTAVFSGVLFLISPMVPVEWIIPVLSLVTAWGGWTAWNLHRLANSFWLAGRLEGVTTSAERWEATKILFLLKRRSLSLGVAELREATERRAMRMAEKSGVSVAASASAPENPAVEVIVVTSRELARPEGRNNLRTMVRNRQDFLIVTDDTDVQREFGSQHVVALPELIGAIPGVSAEKSVVRYVPLADLMRDFERFEGRGFKFYVSPTLGLDTTGIPDEGVGAAVLMAAQNPLVLILESLRAFPLQLKEWKDFLRAIQAVAKYA